MDDPLYDKSHRIIGFVGKLGNGEQVIRDKSHRIQGFYDPKTNTTRDKTHRVVGFGNQLTSLLSNDDKKHH